MRLPCGRVMPRFALRQCVDFSLADIRSNGNVAPPMAAVRDSGGGEGSGPARRARAVADYSEFHPNLYVTEKLGKSADSQGFYSRITAR